MCRIILCKPQREEDKLIDHEEERRQTHPDITNMISPVLTHISLKFYYRKYMLRKKNIFCKQYCACANISVAYMVTKRLCTDFNFVFVHDAARLNS